MSPGRTELEAESWAFALAIYSRPGVAEACLTLQNEAGVDVMLLLMTTFAAVKHRNLLTPSEIETLDKTCRPWREQIVGRLRAIRTELKTGPKPAPSEATEPFRAKIKALELEAEKLENRILAECVPLKPPGQAKIGPEQLRAVLDTIVMHFAGKRDALPETRLSPSIEVIVEAAILVERI
jgi:uncharacterized protein (TIGR02444 family)